MYRRERKTEEGSRVGEKGIWPSPKEKGGGGRLGRRKQTPLHALNSVRQTEHQERQVKRGRAGVYFRLNKPLKPPFFFPPAEDPPLALSSD